MILSKRLDELTKVGPVCYGTMQHNSVANVHAQDALGTCSACFLPASRTHPFGVWELSLQNGDRATFLSDDDPPLMHKMHFGSCSAWL